MKELWDKPTYCTSYIVAVGQLTTEKVLPRAHMYVCMYVCMYVYMCLHVLGCACVHLKTHTHTLYKHAYAHLHNAHTYTSIYVCIRSLAYAHSHTCMHTVLKIMVCHRYGHLLAFPMGKPMIFCNEFPISNK